MPNQYTKVSLFLEDNDSCLDNLLLSKELSYAVIEAIKNILPKDIENISQLLNKIKNEL